MSARGAAAIVAAVALAGCRGGGGQGPRAALRDSAGVTIVENAGPSWPGGAGWRVAGAPTLDLGGVAGDSARDFLGVVGAVRLSSGGVVVANSGTGQLRFFDAGGRFVRAVGRRGRASGEFQAIGWLQRGGGDSLVVFDRQLNRVTLLGPDGALARTIDLVAPDSTGVLQAVGRFPSGDLLAATVPYLRAVTRGGPVRLHVPYLRVDTAGVAHAVAVFWSDEVFVAVSNGLVTAAPLPFGRSTRAAVAGDGFVAGDGSTYEIDAYTSDGVLRRRIRRAHPPVVVTAADLTRYIGERLLSVADPVQRSRREQFWQRAPLPRALPAFGEIRTGPEAELWVEELERPNVPSTRRAIFDSAGRWLGLVDLPPGFTPLDVGVDYLLGRWKDADEVEHVRLYPLDRRR